MSPIDDADGGHHSPMQSEQLFTPPKETANRTRVTINEPDRPSYDAPVEGEPTNIAQGIFAGPDLPYNARGENNDDVTISTAPSVRPCELRPEEEARTTLRKKQLPMREGPNEESSFTVWIETNDSRLEDTRRNCHRGIQSSD